VHHVGILYDQFMMHGQRNIKSNVNVSIIQGRTKALHGISILLLRFMLRTYQRTINTPRLPSCPTAVAQSCSNGVVRQ